VGVVFGGGWGAAAGVLLGISRLGAVLANTIRTFDDGRILSLINTAVFYGVAGLIAGYVFGLLRRAEVQISATAARDEVARTLHDGVLQTLAIVERRSSDPDLVRLAREQDRELRGFLFGDYLAGQGGRDLGAALRHAAARFEEAFGIRAEVVVADDLPRLDEVRVTAVSRAVGEALTNAGKHGNPSRVTVFVEPTDDHAIFCSVKDDGAGFDPAARTTGTGIRRSIMDRMRDAGGQAEVRSGQGSGTEVCLWA
jgi:signal transduction histidine kinase